MKHLGFPELQGNEITSPAREEILQKLQTQAGALKALLRVRILNAEDRYSFRQSLLYHNPANFRIETYPDTAAITLNYFEAKNGNYVFNDSQSESEETGVLTDKAFQDFIQLPFTPEELAYLLMRAVPAKWLENKNFQIIENNQSFEFAASDKTIYFTTNRNLQLLTVAVFDQFRNRKEVSLDYTGEEQIIISGEVPAYQISFRILPKFF